MVNSTHSVLTTSANTDLLTSGTSTPSAAASGSPDFADTLATCMFFGSSGSSQNSSQTSSAQTTSQTGTQSGTQSGSAVQSGRNDVAAATSLMNAAPITTTPPAAATPAAVQATDTAEDTSNLTPDQAYWAAQPPAVQALQNMPDDQRYAAAQDLAKQGYQIDVPIMVWGWDPLATMVIRQNDGLTWVPSALQSNIPVAPGDSFPGLPSYDPNNPPPGSIKVSTAFAEGTNGQDPWITQQQLTASEALNS